MASASYDDARHVLRLAVGRAGSLEDFVARTGGPEHVHYELIPRFFRVKTGGVPDALPDSAYVRILFQGTGGDKSGRPDEENVLVDWTADASRFRDLPPDALRFFRFRVELERDAGGGGGPRLAPPIALDFLRIPFRF